MGLKEASKQRFFRSDLNHPPTAVGWITTFQAKPTSQRKILVSVPTDAGVSEHLRDVDDVIALLDHSSS